MGSDKTLRIPANLNTRTRKRCSRSIGEHSNKFHLTLYLETLYLDSEN
jgi:hypothetical protein